MPALQSAATSRGASQRVQPIATAKRVRDPAPMTNPTARECVEDHVLDTAEAFLEILSPRNALWSENPPAWIYRGQANADWPLKAKAVRDHAYFADVGISVASTRPGYDPADNHPPWSQRAGLLERTLTKFKQGLDRSGVYIPLSSPRTHHREMNQTRMMSEPLPEAFPLMAFAQHHGLPTILLDWSRYAYNAAYFAAADAAYAAKVHRADEGSHLAVWALWRDGWNQSTEGPNFYDAPGATNPNLHAQAGVFTYHSAEDDPSLEQHLVRLLHITGGALPLRRAMLPVSEAPKLLRLLSYEGIDGASMFPGADGVVRAMRESALWDVPSR